MPSSWPTAAGSTRRVGQHKRKHWRKLDSVSLRSISAGAAGREAVPDPNLLMMGSTLMFWRRSATCAGLAPGDNRKVEMDRNLCSFAAALATLALAGCTGPQRVSFPTQDGGVVYADVYGENNRAVVLGWEGNADIGPAPADADRR